MKMSKEMLDLLCDLWLTDRTPVYSYPGECTAKSLIAKAADNFGNLPPRPGQRWWTPRERIEREYPGGFEALTVRARLPHGERGKHGK